MISNLSSPFSAKISASPGGNNKDPGSTSGTTSAVASLGSLLGKRKASTPFFNTDKINTYNNIPDITQNTFTEGSVPGSIAVLMRYVTERSSRSLLLYVDAKRLKECIYKKTVSIFASEGPSRDCYQLKLQEGAQEGAMVRSCYLRSTDAADNFLQYFKGTPHLDIEAEDCILYLKDGALAEQLKRYSPDNPDHPQVVAVRCSDAVDQPIPDVGSPAPKEKYRKATPQAEIVLFATQESQGEDATVELISSAIQQKFPKFSPQTAALIAAGALAAKNPEATVESIQHFMQTLPGWVAEPDYPAQLLAARMPDATVESVTAAKFDHQKEVWKLTQPSLPHLVVLAASTASVYRERSRPEQEKAIADILFNHGDDGRTLATYPKFIDAAIYASKPDATESGCVGAAGDQFLGRALWLAKARPSPRHISEKIKISADSFAKAENPVISEKEAWLAARLHEQPKWWHQQALPSAVYIQNQLSGYIDREPEDNRGLLKEICERVVEGSVSPDHKLLLLLFHFKPHAEQADISSPSIDEILRLCIEKMTLEEKGMTARFASLIDTPEGQRLRNLLFPHLYCRSAWNVDKDYQLPEGHCGWFSTQETLQRQLAEAEKLMHNRMKTTLQSSFPSEVLNNPGIEEALHFACKTLREEAEKKLGKLAKGKEASLPKYYMMGSKVPYHSEIALLKKRMSPFGSNSTFTLNTRRLPFTQTTMLAYGDFALWNLNGSIPSAPLDLIVAINDDLPLYLKDTLVPTTLVVENTHEQKNAIRNMPGTSHLVVLDYLQALLEQYCQDEAVPLLWPQHWVPQPPTNSESAG